MVAVRLADLVTPVRNGRLPGGDCRSALAIGGTERIRSGDQVVFLKVVAVAAARVRRDGRVQAQGSPLDHATLGPLEERLEERAGQPGVIDQIAERAVLRKEFVKGERERLLARAFMIRVIVLMTLLPGADAREAVIALAGDLGMVPWARAWVPASPRALRDWRNALGPEPLEELQAIVLGASWQEHEDRDWRAVIIGRDKPLKTGSLDGTLIRVPDTPAPRRRETKTPQNRPRTTCRFTGTATCSATYRHWTGRSSISAGRKSRNSRYPPRSRLARSACSDHLCPSGSRSQKPHPQPCTYPQVRTQIDTDQAM